jgi:predicted PurR-regulated permease PerM
MEQLSPPASPKWGSTTKLVVGLTVVAITAALIIYFRTIIGPIILAFILTFLLHPVIARVSRSTKMSWKITVNLLYLLLIISLGALITIAGLMIVQQTQSLVTFIDGFLGDVPSMVSNLQTKSYMIGPFNIDLSHLDLEALANKVLGIVQPILGRAGNLVGKIATSAAATAGWGLFVLLISYFILSESSQLREDMIFVKVPGYNADFLRLARELANIWDSFLRGQLIISMLVIISYSIMLSILGMRLTIAIALMAGLARFIPYLGPFVTWTVTAIVAYLQSSNYFGLEPLHFAILVIVFCILLDQIFDNIVVPRIMGQTLGLHPAVVLIAAFIATNLIGIIGLVLAAPVLATIYLLARYVSRKMFDMDPWPTTEVRPKRVELPWTRARRILTALWHRSRNRMRSGNKPGN